MAKGVWWCSCVRTGGPSRRAQACGSEDLNISLKASLVGDGKCHEKCEEGCVDPETGRYNHVHICVGCAPRSRAKRQRCFEDASSIAGPLA